MKLGKRQRTLSVLCCSCFSVLKFRFPKFTIFDDGTVPLRMCLYIRELSCCVALCTFSPCNHYAFTVQSVPDYMVKA